MQQELSNGRSYKRLVFEAIPEIWTFQTFSGFILGILSIILGNLISDIATVNGSAVTTANLGELLTPKILPLLFLIMLMILIFLHLELLSMIYLCNDILTGQSVSIRELVTKGIKAWDNFLTPQGLLVLLYILLAVPLGAFGFSVSLTKNFYIPNFIMDVVYARPILLAAYVLAILLMIYFGYRSIFCLHAMLLEGQSVRQARTTSVEIIKAHGRELLIGMAKLLFKYALIQFAVDAAVIILEAVLDAHGSPCPPGYVVKYGSEFSDLDMTIVIYRTLCSFTVLIGSFLRYKLAMILGACAMLRFTRYYLYFRKGEEPELWPDRTRRSNYVRHVWGMAGIAVFCLVLAGSIGLMYDEITAMWEEPQIVAHRCGGTLASENSLEGLEASIAHGVYAAETDIQRTSDGYYIINHDDDFRRLTGVAKKPGEMTLAEIKQLRIRDTTGNGQELEVATIEEMLDVIKDRIILFIELKGESADNQMVDDIVRIVREKDCVDDVVLISLNYKAIDYAETNYPEFETGTLVFASIGDVASLNCDMILMEEEMASESRIDSIHSAGKKAVVWTVNTQDMMSKFMLSSIDGIITDEITLAEDVRKKIDERSELHVLEDLLSGAWS